MWCVFICWLARKIVRILHQNRTIRSYIKKNRKNTPRYNIYLPEKVYFHPFCSFKKVGPLSKVRAYVASGLTVKTYRCQNRTIRAYIKKNKKTPRDITFIFPKKFIFTHSVRSKKWGRCPK